MNEPLRQSIVVGASEVAVPTFLSTLCICIVFVPVFLLQGTAKYLFSPLSLSVIGALLASLALSFTMVPVLFNMLMRGSVRAFHDEPQHRPVGEHAAPKNILVRFQAGFERGFESFREKYRNALAWTLSEPRRDRCGIRAFDRRFGLLFPLLGRDFFPQVDAGQMRLHVRAPPGTRLEKTQQNFADVEAQIRRLVGNDQINVMLDNIGLPYSGINIALSDSATVGPMDGEILISLNKKHTPTAQLIAQVAPGVAGAFRATAVLFSAGRYRRSGAQLRPACADRCPGIRAGPGRSIQLGVEHRARPDEGAGRGRLACVSSSECAGADRGYGPCAGHRDRRDAARGGQQRAGGHQLERAILAEFLG